MRFVGEPLREIRPVGIEQAFVLPHGGHVAHHVSAGAGPADLVDVVQAVGIQKMRARAQIAAVRMQMGLAEQTGAVAEVAQGAHPKWASRAA